MLTLHIKTKFTHGDPLLSVLIRSESAAVGKPYLGFVSDGSALTHLATHAEQDSTLSPFLGNALGALELPSLHLGTSVVSASASASVLDAMRLMSEEGVSSIAVLEDPAGTLLSAVSVTDIGKVSMRLYLRCAIERLIVDATSGSSPAAKQSNFDHASPPTG